MANIPNSEECKKYSKKEYGPHKYNRVDRDATFCEHDCGCWIMEFDSGGPVGLDFVDGECPKNPKDGEFLGKDLLGENMDWAVIVSRRINKLLTDFTNNKHRLESLEEHASNIASALEGFNRLIKKG